MVYEFGQVLLDDVGPGFAQGFGYVMNGCLVPIIVRTRGKPFESDECRSHWNYSQGMYPTLVIILCAVDKSLHEKSAEHELHTAPSLVFRPPSNRRRETLSEILSASSVYIAEVDDTVGPSEHPEDAMRRSLLSDT